MVYLRGSVRVGISGASCDRFFNLCANRGILLWNVACVREHYECSLSVKDFRRVRPLARKSKTRIRILEKKGLGFFLFRHRKRKLLPAGILFGAFLMVSLSFFVWDIQIEGNERFTEDVIFDFLKENGVYFGTPGARVDCRGLADAMRRQFPDLTWVSVEISGTQLQINVRENTASQESSEEAAVPSDLVADCDGVIESIITRQGVPLVEAGSVVKKGDVLVSGTMEILNDSLETAGYQYCAADADIRIRTSYAYYDSFPMVYEEKIYTGRRQTSYGIRIGQKSVSLPVPDTEYENEDILTSEKKLRLSGNFYLPVSLVTYVRREYQIQIKNYSQEEAEALAMERFQKKLEIFKEKGLQIFENNVKINADAKTCVTAGTLTVIQDAGERVERTRAE